VLTAGYPVPAIFQIADVSKFGYMIRAQRNPRKVDRPVILTLDQRPWSPDSGRDLCGCRDFKTMAYKRARGNSQNAIPAEKRISERGMASHR